MSLYLSGPIDLYCTFCCRMNWMIIYICTFNDWVFEYALISHLFLLRNMYLCKNYGIRGSSIGIYFIEIYEGKLYKKQRNENSLICRKTDLIFDPRTAYTMLCTIFRWERYGNCLISGWIKWIIERWGNCIFVNRCKLSQSSKLKCEHFVKLSVNISIVSHYIVIYL